MYNEKFQTNVGERIKTHILCSMTFFFEKHAVYEIKCKNVLETDRRIAYSIPKATNTHSEYLKFPAFFTTTMVAQTLRIIKLCVYCPPSSNIDSLYSFLQNSV